MKKLHKDQRGLTLVELLIAILLTGIITAAITITIFQVFNINTRTSNRMAAVSQVQQAGKLVSQDILEAQPEMIDDNPTGGEFLILGWKAQNSTEYKVTYTLVDMGGGLQILWREHYIDIGSGPELDSTTKVAEYIDPVETSCVWAGGVLTFTVTATVGEQSETREYEVKPRPGT